MENIYSHILTKYDNSLETWAWIPNFENKYQISNFGRVRSFAGKNNGLPIVPKITKAGYWYVHLSQAGDKPRVKTVGIARVVATVFLPNPEDLAEVDHIDNDKSNNHISNLQWINHDKNVRKNQAYIYKLWNSAKPEEIFWAESKRQVEFLIGKSHGWLSYHIKLNDFPTKDGWYCEVNRVKGSEKKRW